MTENFYAARYTDMTIIIHVRLKFDAFGVQELNRADRTLFYSHPPPSRRKKKP